MHSITRLLPNHHAVPQIRYMNWKILFLTARVVLLNEDKKKKKRFNYPDIHLEVQNLYPCIKAFWFLTCIPITKSNSRIPARYCSKRSIHTLWNRIGVRKIKLIGAHFSITISIWGQTCAMLTTINILRNWWESGTNGFLHRAIHV